MAPLKLPQGWDEVSISKFFEYHTLLTSRITDPIDLEVKLIALFANVPYSEIEALKTKEIYRIAKQLHFLKELPETKVPYKFRCGGNVYKASLIMDDMTAGQLMNFGDILKGIKPDDYIYQMANLIGAMCVKREVGLFNEKGKISFIRYKYSGYKDNAKIFEQHMSIAQAYPYYVFFCKVMEKLLPDMQSYLKKEMKKLMKDRKQKKRKNWDFLNIGGGTQ